jgi:hypothetical protein
MKEEFKKYLKDVDIIGDIRGRVERIYDFYREICPDEITGIFITDYIKEDGERVYEHLWFFSEKYCMEAKQFITTDDFDFTPIKNRITYWVLKKQDYDFKKATEKSRQNLKFRTDTEITGELKASKENCDYLRDIIREYIKSNLKE